VWEGDWSKEKADDLGKEDQNYSLESANILNYGKDVVHLASPEVFIFAQIDVNGEVRRNAFFSCVERGRKRLGWVYIQELNNRVGVRIENVLKNGIREFNVGLRKIDLLEKSSLPQV
jgi:hypothetical protein